MNKIRTLIVDDERLACRRIHRLLSESPDFEVAGECASGAECLAFLCEENGVDLLFLDVQMPEMDGFAVLENLPPDRVPMVVFVTAYDEHVLRAFEVHAFDYLLKPFDPGRFLKMLERVRTQIAKTRVSPGDRLKAMLDDIRTQPRQSTRFAIRTTGRVSFVRQEEIDWVEAADNYVCLHVGSETHLLRATMHSIESRLDHALFARIHRSTIVNLDRVKEMRPWFHGEYVVVLDQGTELTLSRSYRDKVLGALNS